MHWWGSHGALCKACEAGRKAEGEGWAPMGGAPRKVGRGLQGQGKEVGFSPAGTGKGAKGPDQRGTFGGSRVGTSEESLGCHKEGAVGTALIFQISQIQMGSRHPTSFYF